MWLIKMAMARRQPLIQPWQHSKRQERQPAVAAVRLREQLEAAAVAAAAAALEVVMNSDFTLHMNGQFQGILHWTQLD